MEELNRYKEALEKIAKARIIGEDNMPTSEWSQGNGDDQFNDGVTLGEHYQAEIAFKALNP